MALTREDLESLGDFIDSRVRKAVAEVAPAVPETPPEDEVTAARKEAEPYYYVHLADGRVVESQDSTSTHMDGVAVIGRYLKTT